MKKKLLDRIVNFKGDLSSSFELIDAIIEDIEFRITFNPSGVSDPLGTFSNIVRNYRKMGLLHPVEKDGRKLIFNGRNILQFLLIQRFLWLGHNLKRLQPIADISDNNLQHLILTKEVNITDIPEPKNSIPIQKNSLQNNQPWHHFKLKNGIMLQIQTGKYDQDQIKMIRETVKESLDNYLK